jgi:DNA-binding NtrC family response regulator
MNLPVSRFLSLCSLLSAHFTGTAVAMYGRAMKNVLLCSSDTLLVRNLYGILRDLGFRVDTVEHPSDAVQTVLRDRFDFAIVDVEPFGLPTEDAVAIIRNIAPDMPIIPIGDPSADRSGGLESVARTMHAHAV